jgi:ABC-type bacteriocin/lantibiotic exporter with double-glycine peptidase domain
MKTAVQQVFSELEELHPNLFNINTTEGKEFVHHFHKYIAIEKEQIVKAYESLEHRHGEQYYEQTYKQ